MDLRDRVGANLRKLRRLQSLSQEALSLKAGLERGYVGRLERSQYYTSMATVQKLAFALEVDPIELIEPVLITRGKKSGTADHETSDDQKVSGGSLLLAVPFQEGFEKRVLRRLPDQAWRRRSSLLRLVVTFWNWSW